MSNSGSENRQVHRYSVEIPVEVHSPEIDPAVVHATRDISNRGVFVCTAHPLPPNSPVEFTMKLKAHGDDDEIRIACHGTVVRVETLDERNAGMAATIDGYRFLHSKPASA